MDVSVSVDRDGPVATVLVAGEIDVASRPLLDDAIREAVAADGTESVVVDLSGVTFLDSSGIAALLKGRRVADEHQVAYRVTGARDLVQRVLEMTGVWEHLRGSAPRSGQPGRG
jgi:anti-sigma B factor antagonist